MPLVATRGAASAQGFGEFARVTPPIYIEDVFSTYVYTGNNTNPRTITNYIDLAGKGGLVWTKNRNNTEPHILVDTVRGSGKNLSSNNTNAQNVTGSLTAFTSSGYTISNQTVVNGLDTYTYASWTFREQAKFFDVVTYTGNGAASRTINHNLGSTPGCVMIKRTDSTSDWVVWHRSLSLTSTSQGLRLNGTDAFGTPAGGGTVWSSTSPMTSTTFGVGASQAGNWNTNLDTATYVAYLFAHDAGGFGLTGTDNVISCGSTTLSSGNSTVTLGYEPQWLLIKRTDSTSNWLMFDTMRGVTTDGAGNQLYAELSNAESGVLSNSGPKITSTGFQMYSGWLGAGNNGTYIYIAIRRGPMKTPTSGTSVYSGTARRGTGAAATITSGFVTDMVLSRSRIYAGLDWGAWDRLRGASPFLSTNGAQAESTSSTAVTGFDTNSGTIVGTDANALINNNNASFYDYITYQLARAPGFLDVVCYTGTSAARTISHNLTVVPELIIVKSRSATNNWTVYSAATGNTNALILNSTAAVSGPDPGDWNSTTPTASVFSLGGNGRVNASAANYVAYLFATVAGVSKVGSYTGTGALQTINCGFAAGARFVLIKRTDTTGDWWVYDSARGITSGNDPYLFLNSTAAEVTNTNYVDTASTGFQVTAAAPAGLNANGGTYIFLAIS